VTAHINVKISSIAATENYSPNCKFNYAVYLLRKTMNKITTTVFTIKNSTENKVLETKKF